MLVPEDIQRGAAHPSEVGPIEVTMLPLTAVGSVGLGTAHGGMFRCAHYACWDFPLY